MLSQPQTISLLKMCVVVFCSVLLWTANGAHAQNLDCDGGLDPVSPPQTVQSGPIPENCFGGGPPGPNDCTDDGCMIDLLVVYTADARDGAIADGEPIEALIDDAVAAINVAFTNSQIDTYVRLAGTALVVY